MTETATQERPNKVEITDAGPSLKKLRIEIPAETVDEKLGESLETLSVEAVLPGFRKGRAPRKLIERRFGQDVKNETKQQLVATALSKAIEDNKLKVVGDPISQNFADVEVEVGKPLTVEIEVEVLPEFEMPAFDDLKVRKPIVEVTDKMVNDELMKVQINEGELQERESPEPGDYLTGHGVMKDAKGTEFYNIEGAVVRVPEKDSDGSGMILGVAVADFAKQLGLPKPGETATIKVKGPESHEVEGIRGADLTITFTVSRADRIIPAPLADVVERSGFESEEALRNAVRERLEGRVRVQQDAVLRQQVAKYLLLKTKVDLPRRLTSQQAARNLERHRLELMYRGVDPTKIEENMARLRSSSIDMAWRELKLFFILSRIAEEQDIKVEDAEINGRIAQMAFERGVRPDKLRQELIQRRQVGLIFQQIREHKALDAIVAKSDVEEMPVEEFNKVMKAEAEAEQTAYYTEETPEA